MNELKFDELLEVNGGLGGGPSYNHPKPIKLTKKEQKCILGTVGAGGLAFIQSGLNPWAGGFGAMAGAAWACYN